VSDDVQSDAPVRSRWLSWLFGAALLGAVIGLMARPGEAERFARLIARARPSWLLFGAWLQVGTYVADARLLQVALLRAGVAGRLREYMGLGLAKLFIDQTVPTAGVSGTLLLVRALDRRGVSRCASMAALVVNLVSHYAAHSLALGGALAVIWARGELPFIGVFVALVGAFALLALAIPGVLLLSSRGSERLPFWVERLPLVRSWLRALSAADPRVAHDAWLIARSTALQAAVIALDAVTLWAMLRALGFSVNLLPVFASFMLSTLARILTIMPGGIGAFEAASVATLHLLGVPLAAGLAATLLYRGFSYWLPMLPGTLFARREARAA
jgi:uncharacterized membrane protein YbhN (UPF0104 family)